ncbi:MAG: 50S ribosomal protein L35 [Clostridiales bacterium]|jgi:large subunit ribosomal protein L35|nr:50S ribosomal protein L35 [Clostridiales bacterium]
MPKLKTHKGASKRFSFTKNGKIKSTKAFRRHILNKKTTKRKRHLRKIAYLDCSSVKTIKKMLPYA